MRTKKQTEQVRQGTQVNRNTEDRTLYTCRTVPTGYIRTQAVLWAPTFALQCCGRHQLPYQTNTVRLPPHASRHQQCCRRRHLPYQANMVKPHACLSASTVWRAPTSAILEEDDATSHMHLILTVLWALAFTIPGEHGKTPCMPLGINSMVGTDVCHIRRR